MSDLESSDQTKPPTSTKSDHILPIDEWGLTMPLMRVSQGQSPIEIGVKTADGIKFPFLHGESIVFVRDGTSRKPMIRLADGSEVGFDQWKATRREGVQQAIDAIGGDCAYMYYQMLANHPHLEQLDIQTATQDEFAVLRHTAGFWRRPTADVKAPKIIVNAQPGTTRYESLFETREVSARRAAELIGMSFEDFKKRPDLLGLFIFFHEVGHADDYILNYHFRPDLQDPSTENERIRQIEMDTLPVPSSNPVVVREMYDSGELETYFAQYQQYYRAIGINSPEDLLNKHEEAYHNLPTEVYADAFSAQILLEHAQRLGLMPKGG